MARLKEIAASLGEIVVSGGQQGAPATAPVQLTVSDPPNLPMNPTSPVIPVNLAIGLLVGAGFGLAAATLAVRFDDRLRDPSDLADLADRLGPVFWLPNRRKIGVQTEAWREDYTLRLAALHHEFTALPRSRGSVLVLAAATPLHVPSVSRVAADLADTLSLGGRSTALVVLHPDCEAGSMPGLSDFIAGGVSLQAVADRSGPGHLRIGLGTQPLRLLTASEAQIRAILIELGQLAELIVIDAPHLAAPAGTSVLTAMADAVLIVAARGEARAEDLLDARAAIDRWNASYLGLLLVPQVVSVVQKLPWRRPALASAQGSSLSAG